MQLRSKWARELLFDPTHYVGTFDSFVERFIITTFGHLIVGFLKTAEAVYCSQTRRLENKKLHGWTELRGEEKTCPRLGDHSLPG